MTYLDLIRNADRKLDTGGITLGEYEEIIEPLKREIDHVAESDIKVSISCAHENDVVSRKAAIDALARMMPRSYTPDGSHPGDEEIFRVQEVFADCIEALEILPSAQPEIIHCRDCKHHSHDAGYGRDWCNRMSGVFRVKPDDYCSKAERRTDG